MASPATASPKADKSAAMSVAEMSVEEYRSKGPFVLEHGWFTLVRWGFPVVFFCLLMFLLGWPAVVSGTVGPEANIRFVAHFVGYVTFVFVSFAAGFEAKRVLSDIAVNRAVARHAYDRINDARSEGVQRSVDEAKDHFPNNQSLPESQPAMLRLLFRVCQDAKTFRFDSINNLIQPYQRESFALRFRLDSWQRVSLRLGILGAFIGLMLAIKDLRGLQDSEVGNFLPQFLNSLYLKFGASIAGLGGALYVFLLGSIVEKRQAAYFREMEATTDVLLDLVSSSRSAGFLNEFSELRRRLTDLDNRFYNQNLKIEEQNKKLDYLNEHLSKMAAVREHTENFMASVKDSHKQFLGDLKGLYDIASMERIFKSLEQGIERISEQNQAAIAHQFRSGQGAVTESMGQLHRELEIVGAPLRKAIIAIGAIAIVLLASVLFIRFH